MNRHFKWASFIGLSFCALSVAAEHKGAGLSVSGNVEGGYAHQFNGADASKFLIDHANLNTTYTVSDSVKFVFNSGMAFIPGTTGAGATGFDTVSFFSPSGFGGGQMTWSAMGAYLDWKCADGIHTSFGQFLTPFGMESMWDKYDMPTYYNSGTYGSFFAAPTLTGGLPNGNTFGWGYDVGLKVAITDILPGKLEVAITDGRTTSNDSPRATLRWNTEIKSGDMSITPVISVLTGRWNGGPKDLGLSAGFMYKMGAIAANAEFLYGSTEIGNKNTMWAVILEPGFDMGMMMLSAKWEMRSITNEIAGGPGAPGTTDMNVGLALSHTYANGVRVRLAYAHTGFKDAGIGGKVNDIRLLFGTKW